MTFYCLSKCPSHKQESWIMFWTLFVGNQGKFWVGISRQYSSPQNTPSYLRGTICSSFGVTLTTTLGSYLRVPVIHSKIKKATYEYLIDQIKRKLATWKIITLSRATRIVLLWSTLLAIIVYSMQSTNNLKGIIGEIKKLCRNIFWGKCGKERRLHTMNWQCLPKKGGRS